MPSSTRLNASLRANANRVCNVELPIRARTLRSSRSANAATLLRSAYLSRCHAASIYHDFLRSTSTSSMQIAEVLSDLASLRACVRLRVHIRHAMCSGSVADALRKQDHEAALALVTTHKTLPDSSATPDGKAGQSDSKSRKEGMSVQAAKEQPLDPDLQRAMDLIDLHYGLKQRRAQGADMGLERARKAVEETQREMGINARSRKA